MYHGKIWGLVVCSILIAMLFFPAPRVGAAPVTYYPIEDTYVSSAYPSRTFGTSTTLWADASPDRAAYLTFDLSNLGAAVSTATLRLYITDPNNHPGGAVALGTDAWSEGSLTYENEPARPSTVLASFGPVTSGAWIDLDVSSAITGPGVFRFVVTSTSVDGTGISSRESSNPPQLVITQGDSTSPPLPSPSVVFPSRIEAENYRDGGPAVGYSDTTPGNTDGEYRADDVDIAACADPRSGSSCYYVGWISAGEWLSYDVSSPADAMYRFTVRVASPYADRRLHLELDGQNVSGSISLPNTGGWGWIAWADVTIGPIMVSAGTHTLRLVAETGNFDVNFVDVTADDGSSGGGTTGCDPNIPQPTNNDPGTVVVADNFESGEFRRWDRVTMEGDATATVQKDTAYGGSCVGTVHVTRQSNSLANVSKQLPSGTNEIWAVGWFNFLAEGTLSDWNVPTFRFFNDSNRILDVSRQNGSGSLFVRFPNGAGGWTIHSTGQRPALSRWHQIRIHTIVNGNSSTVEVWLNETKVYSNAAVTTGAWEVDTVQIGAEHRQQEGDFAVDDVVVKALTR